jgi:hypothetical protein
MKGNFVKRMMFCLVAMLACAAGVYAAGVNPSEVINQVSDFSPPEWSTATIAMAAVGIPVFDFENLTVITRQEFDNLQAKFGKLYVVDVEIDEGESYQFILKRPTRQFLELIDNSKNDTSKVNELIIKNLVVAGDKSQLDDGLVFSQFNLQAAKIINQGKGFFAKA